MTAGIRTKLSIMMFLEFFVWGAWFVTLGPFLANNLKASQLEAASVFSTQSYGAIIAPFIIGLIADRYWNAERILGILHLIGAVLMYGLYSAPDVAVFFPYALIYMIVYMPTLALVNSVSFRQMSDPEKEFSSIRVFGTIGWIMAGLAISFAFHWDSGEGVKAGLLNNTFLMAGIASLLLGLFSFMLPKTPPIKNEKNLTISAILGLDAIKLLANRNFLVFFLSSILICIPLSFYYQNASLFLTEVGLPNPTGKMTIGQLSEILFLLLLPFFFKRYGFKKTIMAGMLAWGIRYLLFAYGNVDDLAFLLIVGIALHGICYDFFFVAGQIYTDAQAGEKYKSAAQGLITLATYGLGMLIGFWVAGYVSEHFKGQDVVNHWQQVWIVPALIALAVLFLFFIFFKDAESKKRVITEQAEGLLHKSL